MRALPILASLLIATPAITAAGDLDMLQSQNQEYKRQIKDLELENQRLKELLSTAQRTSPAAAPATAAKPAPATVESSPKKESAAAAQPSTPAASSKTTTVRAGDSLEKIARRHGTTSIVLAKLNGIKNPSLIRVGQQLTLPGSTSTPVSAPAASKSETVGGTHVVKSGETFFSISKRYGLGTEALQAANPTVKPESLRPGQTLQLRATKSSSSATPVSAPKPAAPSNTAKKPAPAPSVAAKKPEAPAAAQSAPKEKTTSTASNLPSKEETEPVAKRPTVRSVKITEVTPLSAFAAAHGTSIEKLNALNGLNLKSSTVLAKGSELYVPAQP